MDELENHSLSLLLLLDDHLLPLFLEWCVTNGLSDMVMFLLQADFLRYKSDVNFSLIPEQRSISSITHHINKIYHIIVEQQIVPHGKTGKSPCFRHLCGLLSKRRKDCFTRLKCSGLPFYAIYNKLADAVWDDLLMKGKSIVCSSQWTSLRRHLLACHVGDDELGMESILADPILCKYFERFLQRDPSELASLHCLLYVRKILSQAYPNSAANTDDFVQLSKNFEKKNPEIKSSEIFETFKILLNGCRVLHKQFFPAGTSFLSTFSLSTMMGGLRRNSGPPTTMVANCAGLSEGLRLEIVATLGLNSSVRTEEVDSIDKVYATNCSNIIKNLLNELEKEMVAFLSIKFSEFKSSSDDFFIMVSLLECRKNPSVLLYTRKLEFLYDVVRREKVIHWADSRARGNLFATTDGLFSFKEIGIAFETSLSDEDRVDVTTNNGQDCSKGGEEQDHDKCTTNFMGSLSESSPVLAFKVDLLIPVNAASPPNWKVCPHNLRAWATSDKLLLTQRRALLPNIVGRTSHHLGVDDRSVATDLFGSGPISEDVDGESDASSDYGDDAPIHLMNDGVEDDLLFGNHTVLSTVNCAQQRDRSEKYSNTTLMELDSLNLEKVFETCLFNADKTEHADLVQTIIELLENGGLFCSKLSYESDESVSFCARNQILSSLLSTLFGDSFNSVEHEKSPFLHFCVSMKSILIDEKMTYTSLENLMGNDFFCFQSSSPVGLKKSNVSSQHCGTGPIRGAISLVISILPFHHVRSPLYIGMKVVDNIVASNRESPKVHSKIGTAIHIHDPFSNVWCEILQYLCEIKNTEHEQRLHEYFVYGNQRGFHGYYESIYDLYLGSYSMCYDLWRCLRVSLPHTMVEVLSNICGNLQQTLLKAWPITKQFGPSDFSFASVVDRVRLQCLVHMSVLLLTNQSIVIISHDRTLLVKLSTLLPRILYPFHVFGQTHEMVWINSGNEWHKQVETNKTSYNAHIKRKLFFVDTNVFSSMKGNLDIFLGCCDEDVPIVAFDLDAFNIVKIFPTSGVDISEVTTNTLQHPQLYDTCSLPAVKKLQHALTEVANMLSKSSCRFGKITDLTKDRCSNDHARELLILIGNSAIEMAFHTFYLDLILEPLPKFIQYIPQLKVVCCNMQHVLSELLCNRQHDVTKQGCDHGTSVQKEELLQLNFEEFLAFLNAGTTRSALHDPVVRASLFPHAFYADFFVGLSPTLVNFLQRHGRIIERWSF